MKTKRETWKPGNEQTHKQQRNTRIKKIANKQRNAKQTSEITNKQLATVCLNLRMYKQSGTCGESLPWIFVLLRQSVINLHWVDSPVLARQDDTVFCWLWRHMRQMTSLIRHLGSAILDFTIFLKSQKITEINTKSRISAIWWRNWQK